MTDKEAPMHTARLSLPRIFRLPSSGKLGNLSNLAAFRRDRLGLLTRLSETGADLVPFTVGPLAFVLVNTPALARDILVTQAEAFEKGDGLRLNGQRVFGNGLVTSLNAFHKRQRKLVAPAFSHRRVAGYADVMADYAERLQRTWANGATINVAREMHRLTLWIVGKTLFDADLLGEAAELGDVMATMQRGFNDRSGRLLPRQLPWIAAQERRSEAAAVRLDTTIYRLIAERRASGEDRGDLLSMLLAARDADDGSFMTDQQVRDEAITLFLAGHETTATALAWTWSLLTKHPDVYAKLRDEVTTALGGRTPTYADLAQLPYTARVLKEAMRLYPPVPMVVRQTSREVTVGRQTFPTNTRFVISPYTMHRQPAFFPDPQRFDPERFTPEAEAKLPRDAYLPFVDGPRNCIGSSFASMEGQIILATLAGRVTFTAAPRQRTEPGVAITLFPRHGVQVKVVRDETESR